jgi:AcrR family transcriptional regulator
MSPAATRFNRREQILEAATTLFCRFGYDGTAIRAIAKDCGITEAAIYRHFKGKAHLYEEVIRAKAAEHDIPRRVAALTNEGPIESVLSEMATAVLDLASHDPQLMAMMFHNSLESGEMATLLFREIRMPFIENLAAELDRRVSLGQIRPIEPFITARCFIGMVMDCALNIGVWEKITETQFQAGDVVCNNVPIFARGLEPVGVDYGAGQTGSMS